MSKKVDEKVVSLKFDNQNFEKNVKQSMNTIDRLKEKLNFNGMSKGLNDLQRSADKVDFGNMEKALDLVNYRFSTMGIIGTTVLQNLTNSVVNFGKQAASTITSSIVNGGRMRAQNIKNAKFQIEGLLGTEEYNKSWSRIDKSIEYAVKDTAYGYDSAAKAASQLLASQINIGEDMDKSLRAISGVAAMTNSSYDDIANVFTRVAGQGRVMALDLNSLAARGMNAAAVLAKSFGLTEAEIRDLVRQGKISFQDFANAMDDAFGEHAKKGNETFEGSLANMKAALARIGAKIWDPLLDNMRDFFNAMRINFNKLNERLDPVIKWFNSIINAFFTKITKIVSGMDSIHDRFAKIQNGISNLVKPAKNVVDTVDKISKSMEVYSKLTNEIIRGNWGNGQDRMNRLSAAGYEYAHAQNLVNEALGCTVRHYSKLEEEMKKTSKGQSTVSEGNKEVSKSTAEVVEELSKLSDEQLKSKGYTDEQIAAIRELIEMSKKLGMPIKELIDNLDNLNGKFLIIESFKNIGTAIIAVFKAIGSAWKTVFPPKDSSDTLFNVLAGFYKFTRGIRDFVTESKRINNITDIFTGLFSVLKLIKDIILGGVKFAFNALATVIGRTFNTIHNATKDVNFGILDILSAIGRFLTKSVDWVYNNNLITKTFNALGGVLVEVVGKIKHFIDTNKTCQVIIKKLSEILNSAKKAFESWLDGLINADNKLEYIFGNLLGNIKKLFASLKDSKQLNFASKIFEGLVQGIKLFGGNSIKAIMTFFTAFIEAAKGVLGIHSPSKVFFGIGTFIMLGLLNGLVNGEGTVLNRIKTFGKELVAIFYGMFKGVSDSLTDIFKNLDLGSILTIAIASIGGIGFLRVTRMFDALADGIYEINDVIETTKKAIQGLAGALKFKMVSEGFKSLAIAIATLVGSIIALTLVDQKKVWGSVKVIGALVGIMAGLVVAIGAANKLSEKGNSFNLDTLKLAATIIALGFAISLISKAISNVASIKNIDNVGPAVAGIVAVLSTLILGLAILTSKSEGKVNFTQSKQTAKQILIASLSLLVIAQALKTLGKMDEDQLLQGSLAVSVIATSLLLFIGAIVGLETISSKLRKRNGKVFDSIGDDILKISTSLLLITKAIKSLGKANPNVIEQGISTIIKIGGLILVFASALTLLNIAGSLLSGNIKNTSNIGDEILKISGSILIMSIAVKMLGKMKESDITKAITTLAGIVLLVSVLASLLVALNTISGKAADVGKSLLYVGATIMLMAGAVALLGMMKQENIDKGMAAIAKLTIFVSGLILIASKITHDVKSSLIGLSILIGVLVGSVVLLGMIKNENLKKGVTAIGILLTFMSLLVAATSLIKKIPISAIVTLGLILVGLTASLYVLAQLNPDAVLKSAIGMGVLLLALSTSLGVLSIIGVNTTKALPALLGLAGLIAEMFLIILVLKAMEGIQNASQNAEILSKFMLILSGVLIVTALVGTLYTATGGIAATGLLGILAIIGSLYLVLGALAIMSNIKNAESNITLLISFMTTMSTMLTQLALVGPLALIGASSISVLMSTMVAFIGFITVIGALVEKFPIIKNFVDNGLELFTALANGLGKIIGTFVKGMALEVANILPEVGTKLSMFAVNATPFLLFASQIKPSLRESIKTLSEAILIITAANLLESITSFITGTSSLEEFGSQLGDLGTNIATFAKNLGDFDDSKVKTIDCASKAIKYIAEAAKGLPNEGGLISKLLGENSLATFGNELPKLGTNIAGFVNALVQGGVTEENANVADTASKIIKTIAESAKLLPNEGGALAALLGDNGLSKFSSDLPKLGENLAGFINKMSNIKPEQASVADTAAKIIKAISGLASNVDKNTSKNIMKFSESFNSISSMISKYVSSIDKISEESIEGAIEKTNKIIGLTKNLKTAGGESLKSFSKDLKNVATIGIKGFTDELGKTNYQNTAKDNITKVVNAALNKIKSIVNGKNGPYKLGSDFVNGFVNGINENVYKAGTAGTALGNRAYEAAKKAIDSNSPSKKTYELGTFFGQGFYNGISEYYNKVGESASGLGNEAVGGLKSVMSSLSNIIESGIDSDPVIKPVLDLSDIEAQSGMISNMLNSQSMDVNGNLSSISYGMSRRSVTTNGDIVDAIGRLNTGEGVHNTYNFGGITYDDGSEIQQAVATLIRAVNMERRS